MTPLLTSAQVGRLLGHSHEWFVRHRKRLETDHAFPPPVAGVGYRWDPTAIAAWLATQRGPHVAEGVEALLALRARNLHAAG